MGRIKSQRERNKPDCQERQHSAELWRKSNICNVPFRLSEWSSASVCAELNPDRGKGLDNKNICSCD